MRAAIYARVSTKEKSPCPHCGKVVRVLEDRLRKHDDRSGVLCQGSGERVAEAADRGQDTDNQLIHLREYSTRQGWAIAKEYIDRETGKHSNRDAFKELFEDALKRTFDVVLVWALDRFTREGVYETFDHVHRLSLYGVQFESFTEAHFRTTGPAGELMLAIAAWIAKQERLRISERTKAGIARARAQGKHCGRPVRVFRRARAAELRKQGESWRAIARALGVPQTTIRRSLAA
jgi:DNA invertase Pin-like site-specific DNA recombinase